MHATPLHLEVVSGERIGGHDRRNSPHYLHSEAFELRNLLRIVRHELDGLHAERVEHCRCDVVLSGVDGEVKQLIGLDGIRPSGLQSVSANLIRQPDSSPLLAQVEHGTHAAARYFLLSTLQLLLAVALHRTKYLAREAL